MSCPSNTSYGCSSSSSDDPARRQTLRRAAKARLRVFERRQVRRRAEQHGHDVEPRECVRFVVVVVVRTVVTRV